MELKLHGVSTRVWDRKLVYTGHHNYSSHQVVDPSKSSVDLLGTKAEIKLRKAESFSWANLRLEESKPVQQQ